jgi:SAM-dependent methyltransferase
MRIRDAVAMLSGADLSSLGLTTWADLGCGDGTFTVALAEVLAPGSVIHAMDVDASALRRIPASHQGVSITVYRGDFTSQPWPFGDLDGVLMANSLHFVRDQPAFVRVCESSLRGPRRFLIVEYDTSVSNPWVPYPVSRDRLGSLFVGYSVDVLGSRASRYQRARLYAALCVG